MFWSRLRAQSYVVQFLWATLVFAFLAALYEALWALAFVSLATFLLTLLPVLFVRRFGITLPLRFVAGIVVFIYATIFLGEAFDFYNRYWWWDVTMHASSATGIGLLGFLFVFMLFEGDRYAAPAWAMAMIAFSLAVAMGGIWEIFEYAIDQNFALNMQKSGLSDTMWDLIVNAAGSFIAALAGFLYLKGRDLGGLGGLIGEFIGANRRLFRRHPKRME